LPNGLVDNIMGVTSTGASILASDLDRILKVNSIINLKLTSSSPVTVGRKAIPDADHPFMAPGSTDIRGGCPGLNVMANYGYISRTGITDIHELMYGMQEMLGFGPDTAALLVILGVKAAVDLTTFKLSIGRTDPRTNGVLSSVFGQIPGFFSPLAHNKFEVDGSLSRVDEYFAQGDTDHFTSEHWKKFRTLSIDHFDGLMTSRFCGAARFQAYQDCRNNNPHCQWAIGEQLALYVAQSFVSKTMASAAPDGSSGDPDVKSIESFFGIFENDNGTYYRGDNKLLPGPDGFWYRRTVPLSLVEAALTLTDTYLAYPTEFGRNGGTLGNWNPDLTQLQNVEEAGVICYLLQQTRDPNHNATYSNDSSLTEALGKLFESVLKPIFEELSCS